MEKIKDLTKVILQNGHMMIEMKEPKKRMIITPDGADSPDVYAVIINVDPSVTKYKVGDIVIKLNGKLYGWPVKQPDGTERNYCIVHEGNLQAVVTPDNFIDPDELVAKVRL